MANLVYKRVSTDQQSTARQNLVLDEAGIEDPVVFEEDPGTSSRFHPLQRPKFRELLTYARPGDTLHISEMFRLVRGTGHILDVLDVLHRDQVALRIHDGAFSAMDLTARHPRTGELLSTVKFMVQTLAAAGELQRDLQRELTYDGLRAAEAKGSKGGRRRGTMLGLWIREAEQSTIGPLRSFGSFLRQDLDAVTAGLTLPYSSGVVEGHVAARNC
ncbi:recombinase family protein [Streptomyces globisporus]|uniref:recombinase family protein n=1 Tax=Streptomyces globisporus TaxID=1908 RepID=UPI000A862602|nr:recombinase family protein [Streptomyces globisporus]